MAALNKVKQITLDGWRYEIRDGKVWGQVHRDSAIMDLVIDPQVIAEVKSILQPAAVTSLGKAEAIRRQPVKGFLK